jgi:hypothetical protein
VGNVLVVGERLDVILQLQRHHHDLVQHRHLGKVRCATSLVHTAVHPSIHPTLVLVLGSSTSAPARCAMRHGNHCSISLARRWVWGGQGIPTTMTSKQRKNIARSIQLSRGRSVEESIAAARQTKRDGLSGSRLRASARYWRDSCTAGGERCLAQECQTHLGLSTCLTRHPSGPWSAGVRRGPNIRYNIYSNAELLHECLGVHAPGKYIGSQLRIDQSARPCRPPRARVKEDSD